MEKSSGLQGQQRNSTPNFLKRQLVKEQGLRAVQLKERPSNLAKQEKLNTDPERWQAKKKPVRNITQRVGKRRHPPGATLAEKT